MEDYSKSCGAAGAAAQSAVERSNEATELPGDVFLMPVPHVQSLSTAMNRDKASVVRRGVAGRRKPTKEGLRSMHLLQDFSKKEGLNSANEEVENDPGGVPSAAERPSAPIEKSALDKESPEAKDRAPDGEQPKHMTPGNAALRGLGAMMAAEAAEKGSGLRQFRPKNAFHLPTPAPAEASSIQASNDNAASHGGEKSLHSVNAKPNDVNVMPSDSWASSPAPYPATPTALPPVKHNIRPAPPVKPKVYGSDVVQKSKAAMANDDALSRSLGDDNESGAALPRQPKRPPLPDVIHVKLHVEEVTVQERQAENEPHVAPVSLNVSSDNQQSAAVVEAGCVHFLPPTGSFSSPSSKEAAVHGHRDTSSTNQAVSAMAKHQYADGLPTEAPLDEVPLLGSKSIAPLQAAYGVRLSDISGVAITPFDTIGASVASAVCAVTKEKQQLGSNARSDRPFDKTVDAGNIKQGVTLRPAVQKAVRLTDIDAANPSGTDLHATADSTAVGFGLNKARRDATRSWAPTSSGISTAMGHIDKLVQEHPRRQLEPLREGREVGKVNVAETGGDVHLPISSSASINEASWCVYLKRFDQDVQQQEKLKKADTSGVLLGSMASRDDPGTFGVRLKKSRMDVDAQPLASATFDGESGAMMASHPLKERLTLELQTSDASAKDCEVLHMHTTEKMLDQHSSNVIIQPSVQLTSRPPVPGEPAKPRVMAPKPRLLQKPLPVVDLKDVHRGAVNVQSLSEATLVGRLQLTASVSADGQHKVESANGQHGQDKMELADGQDKMESADRQPMVEPAVVALQHPAIQPSEASTVVQSQDLKTSGSKDEPAATSRSGIKPLAKPRWSPTAGDRNTGIVASPHKDQSATPAAATAAAPTTITATTHAHISANSGIVASPHKYQSATPAAATAAAPTTITATTHVHISAAVSTGSPTIAVSVRVRRKSPPPSEVRDLMAANSHLPAYPLVRPQRHSVALPVESDGGTAVQAVPSTLAPGGPAWVKVAAEKTKRNTQLYEASGTLPGSGTERSAPPSKGHLSNHNEPLKAIHDREMLTNSPRADVAVPSSASLTAPPGSDGAVTASPLQTSKRGVQYFGNVASKDSPVIRRQPKDILTARVNDENKPPLQSPSLESLKVGDLPDWSGSAGLGQRGRRGSISASSSSPSGSKRSQSPASDCGGDETVGQPDWKRRLSRQNSLRIERRYSGVGDSLAAVGAAVGSPNAGEICRDGKSSTEEHTPALWNKDSDDKGGSEPEFMKLVKARKARLRESGVHVNDEE